MIFLVANITLVIFFHEEDFVILIIFFQMVYYAFFYYYYKLELGDESGEKGSYNPDYTNDLEKRKRAKAIREGFLEGIPAGVLAVLFFDTFFIQFFSIPEWSKLAVYVITPIIFSFKYGNYKYMVLNIKEERK